MLVTTGSNVCLFCNASGHPDLEYSWAIPFDIDQDRVSGLQSHALTIENVGIADSMNYTCNVSLFGQLIGVSTVSLEIQGELQI